MARTHVAPPLGGIRHLTSASQARIKLVFVGSAISELECQSFNMPPIEEPNDEDEILSRSTAARTVTRDSYGSGANKRRQRSAAGIRKRGPRGRGSALERRLHDRPRPEPMRRAHVDLCQPRPAPAIQECALTFTCAPTLALPPAILPAHFSPPSP